MFSEWVTYWSLFLLEFFKKLDNLINKLLNVLYNHAISPTILLLFYLFIFSSFIIILNSFIFYFSIHFYLIVL